MRYVIPLVGIGLIVTALLISFFYVAPVTLAGSESSDLNNDGQNDSTYSVTATLLNDDTPVSVQQFSLTYEGAIVTELRIAVSWDVNSEPEGSIDLTTLSIQGEVKFEYLVQYGPPPFDEENPAPYWQEFLTEPFSSVQQSDSWLKDYSLASLLTDDRESLGTEGLYWMLRATISLSASAQDFAGVLHESAATPLAGSFKFVEGADAGGSAATSFSIEATSTGVIMSALSEGVSISNPVFVLIIAGIVFIPLGFCIGKR